MKINKLENWKYFNAGDKIFYTDHNGMKVKGIIEGISTNAYWSPAIFNIRNLNDPNQSYVFGWIPGGRNIRFNTMRKIK